MSKMIIESQNLHDIVNSLHDKFDTAVKLQDKEISPTIDNLPETTKNLYGFGPALLDDFLMKQAIPTTATSISTDIALMPVRDLTTNKTIGEGVLCSNMQGMPNDFIIWKDSGYGKILAPAFPAFEPFFANYKALTTLNLSNFDTSKVTDMNGMFFNCSHLNTLNLSNFNTSEVTITRGMFSGCRALTDLDISHFDTSKVIDMAEMFAVCQSLTTLDLSNFNTSQVLDMTSIFGGCSSLTTLDLSSFDTSKVTDMQYMFNRCTNLKTVYCRNQEEINRYKATNPPANINFVIKGGTN